MDETIIELHVPKKYFKEMKYWAKKTDMELGEMIADAFEQWKFLQSAILEREEALAEAKAKIHNFSKKEKS